MSKISLKINQISQGSTSELTTVFYLFQCIHMSGKGFIPGAYQCHCVDGYYFRHEGQEGANSYFNGSVMEEQRRSNQSDVTSFKCLPCQAGCNSCLNAAPCLARYDVLLRGIPLGIQSFCMTISIVLGLVILRLRRSKVRLLWGIGSANERRRYDVTSSLIGWAHT